MSDSKKTQEKHQSFKKLLASFLLTVAILVSFSFVAALILKSRESSFSDIRIYSLVVLVVSAAVSGFFNSKREGAGASMLTAVLFSLVMLLAGAVFSAGKITEEVLMNYGCFILVSLVGAYLGGRKKQVKRRRRR